MELNTEQKIQLLEQMLVELEIDWQFCIASSGLYSTSNGLCNYCSKANFKLYNLFGYKMTALLPELLKYKPSTGSFWWPTSDWDSRRNALNETIKELKNDTV